MKSLDFGRRGLICCTAVALFAGCGGPQPPIGATPQTSALAAHAGRSKSWMLPEAKSASQLLYVTSYQTNDVSVLELPKGKLVGTLSGFESPSGECTDAKGNVFITDLSASQIWEYQHGAQSPKNILYDPEYGPLGCSFDPTTGDLAVSNEIKIEGSIGPGNIAIYAHASGKPKLYFDTCIYQFGFCSYDGSGTLYTGGGNPPSVDLFAELPKKGKKLTVLTLNESVSGGSAMQWDGEDLAIVAGEPGSLIYRFKISGSTGIAVDVLRLKHTSYIGDFAIQGQTLYAPLVTQNEVALYAYPKGGNSLNKFFGFGEPGAAAVSILPQ
jgi:hypothetical protein